MEEDGQDTHKNRGKHGKEREGEETPDHLRDGTHGRPRASTFTRDFCSRTHHSAYSLKRNSIKPQYIRLLFIRGATVSKKNPEIENRSVNVNTFIN